MSRLSRVLLSAAVIGGLATAEASGQGVQKAAAERRASAPGGRIQGTVSDVAGAPLSGAMVSALGPTATFALTDSQGRFELSGLPAGPYVLRAHYAGFAASHRRVIEVASSEDASSSFALHRMPSTATSPAGSDVLEAGFAGIETAPQEPEQTEVAEAEPESPSHDHGETAWRLRHVKRSVLRDTESPLGALAGDEDPVFRPGRMSRLGRAFESSARYAATLFDDLPVSGQVNLLTTSTFEHPTELLSGERLPRGIAYVSIGAPAGPASDWSVHAAMTDGDLSSWILAGTYATHRTSGHSLDLGLSYSAQHYQGGNPAALAALSADRKVGAVHVYDTWQLARVVSLDYGGRYAWHDYLDRSGLFSPTLAVTVAPASKTRVRLGVEQRMLAPGAEEFLPPAPPGLWLPPERTFSPLDAAAPLRVERNRQYEVALEQELGGTYIIGVRRFHERVSDQLVTLFGTGSAALGRADLGHYFVASAGSVDADGWSVTFRRPVARRLKGSVDYSLTRASWSGSSQARLVERWAPSAVRVGEERFHDVTTALETDIPETATRVFVTYRVNTAYTRAATKALAPGLEARFDVQIKQALPFLPFGTQWEMLLAVRNLFHESGNEGSAYDELLVVAPPKRIVGGLLVKF